MLLRELFDLGRFLELFRDTDLCDGRFILGLEFLRGDFLIFTDLLTIKEEALLIVESLYLGWIGHAEVAEKLIIDEPQQGHVELSEGANDLVVDIEGQSLVEGVGCNPGDRLAEQLDLCVDSLDREEALLHALGDGAVGHPLGVELLADGHVLRLDLQRLVLREIGKQTNQAQGIVEVAQGIVEAGVAFSNDLR